MAKSPKRSRAYSILAMTMAQLQRQPSAPHEPDEEKAGPDGRRSRHAQRPLGCLRRNCEQPQSKFRTRCPQQALDHHHQPESDQKVAHRFGCAGAPLFPDGLVKYLKNSLSGASSMRVSPGRMPCS